MKRSERRRLESLVQPAAPDVASGLPHEIREILLDEIVVDPEIQPRVNLDKSTIQRYADVISRGGALPPGTVYEDESGRPLLIDGGHRLEAGRRVGKKSLPFRVVQCCRRDAILLALAANQGHGLRLSSADKRKAVDRLLQDPEWSGWSDGTIARKVGVSQPFVSRRRRELIESGDIEQRSTRQVRRKDGREYAIATENLGSKAGTTNEVSDQADTHPNASLLNVVLAAPIEDQSPVLVVPGTDEFHTAWLSWLRKHVGDQLADPSQVTITRVNGDDAAHANVRDLTRVARTAGALVGSGELPVPNAPEAESKQPQNAQDSEEETDTEQEAEEEDAYDN